MATAEERILELERQLAQVTAERDHCAHQVERLNLVLDGALLGIWDWNVQTGAVVFNKRWKNMLGYEMDELADELATWEKLLCPEDAGYVYSALTDHLEGRTPVYATEHRVLHKDGHWVWILDIGRVVAWDAEGKPLRATGIHQDISARKAMELALKEARDHAEQANQTKSMFLATMSHEIRTPMVGILGAGNLILESHLDHDQLDLCKMLVRSTEGLLDILNDILDLSKIEANKLDIEQIPLNLRDQLEGIVHLFTQKADEKSLALRLAYDARLPEWIVADPTRLRQILLNLVGNALKFTQRGEVVLKAALNDDTSQLTITIEDTGIGMSPDQLDHVFDQFHQADATISRRFGGTGLGTTISRRLARLMGGDITVDSSLGVGTQFTVVLPVMAAEAPEPKVETNLRRNYGKVVILAEDNLINRKIAERVLNTLGLTIISARHGQEVLDQVDQPHHLILMDCQMPILDGIKTTEILRNQGYCQPIVALSANVYREDRERFAEAGMDDFIPKPFDKATLVKVLDRFLVA